MTRRIVFTQRRRIMGKERPHLRSMYTHTHTHSQLKSTLCSNNRLKQTNIPCSLPPSSSSFHTFTRGRILFFTCFPLFLFSPLFHLLLLLLPSSSSLPEEFCFHLYYHHLLLMSSFFPSPDPSSSPPHFTRDNQYFHYHTPEEFKCMQTQISAQTENTHQCDITLCGELCTTSSQLICFLPTVHQVAVISSLRPLLTCLSRWDV